MSTREEAILAIDRNKFPFLFNARVYIEEKYGVDITTYISRYPSLVESTEKYLASIISGYGEEADSREDRFIVFYLSTIIAYSIGDRWLITRLALWESDRAINYLREVDDNDIVAFAKIIGVSTLEYLGERGYRELIAVIDNHLPIYRSYPFRMRLTEYLRVTKRLLGDPQWTPTNNPVKAGYIYLKREKVLRILKEALTSYIESKIMELGEEAPEDIRSSLATSINKVKNTLAEVARRRIVEVEREASIPTRLVEDAFPPCISHLATRARAGEHLSHHERFALATFLLNIGAEVDYVVDVFRSMPDFNEKRTRYQVEHLAGMRGSGRRYLTYSCEKMKTLGMCRHECGVKTPLQEYRRRIRQSSSSS